MPFLLFLHGWLRLWQSLCSGLVQDWSHAPPINKRVLVYILSLNVVKRVYIQHLSMFSFKFSYNGLHCNNINHTKSNV